jgi:hypothetical protein
MSSNLLAENDEFISPISFERCEIRMRLLLEEYRLRVLQQSSDHLVFSAQVGQAPTLMFVEGDLLRQGTDTRVRLRLKVGRLAKLLQSINIVEVWRYTILFVIAFMFLGANTGIFVMALVCPMLIGAGITTLIWFQFTEPLHRFTLFLREAFLPSDRVHIEERKGHDQKEKR